MRTWARAAWCPRCPVLHDSDGGGEDAGQGGEHLGQGGNTPGGCRHDHEAERIPRDRQRIGVLLVSHGVRPFLSSELLPPPHAGILPVPPRKDIAHTWVSRDRGRGAYQRYLDFASPP